MFNNSNQNWLHKIKFNYINEVEPFQNNILWNDILESLKNVCWYLAIQNTVFALFVIENDKAKELLF